MSVQTASSSSPQASQGASFAELFTPKLVTVLREGYTLKNLRADALSGLTVAIVALPLSMAIAIASGASPAQGLYTAAVGGFLVSLLGGSRFQIGGPAGAFIVLVAATVAQHGMDGLILATFFLTIFRDLTEAIVVGFALGSVLFIHRMSKATAVETHTPFVGEDVADSSLPRGGYDEALAANPELVVYRITGAFFFGAAASIASVLDRIQDTHKALIVDFAAVPFLDSTGANVMEGLAHKAAKRGVKLFVSAANTDVRRSLLAHGVRPPGVHFAANIEDALTQYGDGAST